jgi:hypothetical protein
MRTVFLFLLPVVLLASCETAEFIQHTPTLANTGQHTTKDQLHSKLLYTTGNSSSNDGGNSNENNPYESVNGIQAQVSYSISNSLALQSSFMHSSERGGSEKAGQKKIVYRYNRNITEGGLAFYDNLNIQKTVFIELAGGAGVGTFKATEAISLTTPGGRFYNNNIFKLYLQPSLYYVSENICISGGAKFSAVNFNNITSNYTDEERIKRSITTGNSLHTTTADLFLKTDIFLSKLPWLGLHLQILHSTDLNKKFNYNQNDRNAGIGLSFRFDKMSTKK